MYNKSFTTTCPVCGNAIDVTLNEHECEKAIKRGATKAKAEDRLEALRKAGVNVGNLFAMRGASGEDMIVRLQDGKVQQVNDDDPIFKAIENGGTISNSTLYRRWVMSQLFHMEQKTYYSKGGFHENLKRKGYEYMWKMTEEELRVQERLYRKDKENFAARNRWFNKELAESMCEQYLADITVYFKGLTSRKCRGRVYKRIHGNDIFVTDFPSRVYAPLKNALDNLRSASTPYFVYTYFRAFNSKRYSLPYSTAQYKDWQNAYKGVGAYYTMKNLILFHGCYFFSDDHCVLCPAQHATLRHLEELAIGYSSDKAGWRMLSACEKMISDNGIDIDKTIESWRKK